MSYVLLDTTMRTTVATASHNQLLKYTTMADVKMTTGAEAASKVSIGSFYLADAAAAVSASFLVSPLITIVDRAIVQNASGAMKMGASVKAGLKELVSKPHIFLRRPEFFMIWGVYASTYVTANSIITTCERQEMDAQWSKFIGTTAVNMVTCMSKDRAFTRMFGTAKPKAVPIPTYLFFTVRDTSTVGASFNLPAPVSSYLQERYDMSKASADITAQMVCPAGVQFLSSPLHLLGLDLYNNPASSISKRAKFIGGTYFSSVAARICRIGPAFSIGGVGNTAFRKFFRDFAGC